LAKILPSGKLDQSDTQEQSILFDSTQQDSGYGAVNGTTFGGIFFSGAYLPKNQTYSSPFRQDTTSIKYTSFLISKKEAKIALHGPHLYC
jgi:hypothetical protein